jgi:hypothetical protein
MTAAELVDERHEYAGRRKACETCGRGRRAAIHTRRPKENGEFVAFARRMIRAMGERAGGDIDTLGEIGSLQAELDAQLHRAVGACRAEGYSWAEIAGRLGVTRQAAFKRFAASVAGEFAPEPE